MGIINLAIVEDDEVEYAVLREAVLRYEKEKNVKFYIVRYLNAEDFLQKQRLNLDIVFMDIEFPDGMNGVRAAKKFRQVNQTTILIFVTNIKKFVANGYEVGALNYILKPIKYYSLAMTMDRALSIIGTGKSEPVRIRTSEGYILVDSRDVVYLEVMKHEVTIHTVKGIYYNYGSLKDWEKLLARYKFVRCNSSTLVNLRYLREIRSDEIVVEESVLRLGRSKKESFMQSVAEFLGENL